MSYMDIIHVFIGICIGMVAGFGCGVIYAKMGGF